MIDITGFAPGIDPTTPGVITDCVNMLPTTNGMASTGAGAGVGVSALAAQCLGAITVKKLDNSARTFAGTDTKLYEVSGGAWTDRSRAGNYSTGSKRWRFAQFGDVSLAVNYLDATQFSTTAAFADLALAPKAKIVETASGFVMLFGYNDGLNNFTDGWYCSGLYDYTAWTPSAATQCANGRLYDTPGPITGAKRLGNAVAVYKDNAVYLGQYVGPPVIWSWQQITANAGAYCHEAVVDVSGVHYFLGRNGLFMFDGSRPQAFGAQEVREWLRVNINPSYTGNIVGGYDTAKALIYWFYPSIRSSGVCDEAIVYNTITGQFGRMTRNVNAIIDYTGANLTWSGVGALGATWTAMGSALSIWADPILFGAGVGLSFISNDDNILYAFGGTPTTASITTGDLGDDTQFSTIQRVRPRFLDSPDSATLQHYWKNQEGDYLQTGPTATLSDGKFDILKSARFHRLKMTFTGNAEIMAYDVKAKANGTR